jgi:twitching motility protein PilT
MLQIDDYLRRLAGVGAQDLFLSSDRTPLYRASNELLPLPGEGSVSDAELRDSLQELLSADEWSELQEEQHLAFVAEIGHEQRVRGLCSVAQHGLTVRLTLLRTADVAGLSAQLPAAITSLVEQPAGLVIVTGPSGSGKTSVISSLLSLMAARRMLHIATCENLVEYLHVHPSALVSQRAVGRHAATFAQAIDSALDTNADVIACSELNAPGAFERLLEAACAGLLVLGELRGQGAVHTIEQLLAHTPTGQRAQRCSELADCLLAVVSLDLLPRRSGGRVLATEVLLATPSVAALIRDGKMGMLPSLLDREPGMQSMDRCLLDLATRGVVDGREAYVRAVDKRLFAAWG